MRCISGARMNMKADILRQGASITITDPSDSNAGEYVTDQDPLTHEIVRVWRPIPIVLDDPGTPDVDEATYLTVPCEARGIITHGATGLGNTESFDEVYAETEMVRMKFPAHIVLTRRDRVTNIRNQKGQIVWKDEETNPSATNGWRATVFDIQGVTPILDPFGNHVENMAMLRKAEAYGG